MPQLNLPIDIPSHATEPMFGGSAGRSYDGGREVFLSNDLTSPFFGDQTLADFTGDTGVMSSDDSGLSASGAGTITTGTGGPASGETFCANVEASSAANAWLLYFGTVDSANTYMARVDFGAGELAIGELVSGTAEWYDTASASVASSTSYLLEVSWYTDSKIRAKLFDPNDSLVAEVVGEVTTAYTASGYGHEFTGAGLTTDALEDCGTVGAAGMIHRHTEGWEITPPTLSQQNTTESWEVNPPTLTQQHVEGWE